MERDLKLAKDILFEDRDLKIVMVKEGNILYKSKERGILPMYEIATKYKKEALRASIADRVIGRGAGILARYVGVSNIYGEVISDGAIDIFTKENINYEFSKRTDYIENRDKTGYCPIEKMSINIYDGEILLKKLKEFLNK